MPISPPKQTVVTLSREEMRSRALTFAKDWARPQREEAEAKTFLDQFFEIFGRDRRSVDARFEHRVEREDRGEGRIDLFWPGKLVVEMKSTGRDLSAEKGGAARQAFDYVADLDPDELPRWVMVSDFAHFALYDLGEDVHEFLKGFAQAKKRQPEPVAVFAIRDLPDKLRHFAFIRDEEQALFQTQPDVNLKAVALLGELHDELKKSGYTGHRLERFLVRVLFCLFAEDTDIFEWNSFTRFIEGSKKDGSDLGNRMAQLFQVLDQESVARSKNIPVDMARFPYVNGGLFAERLDIADMTTDQRAALIQCCRFDWSRISPSVFGSLFQGVMEKRERRAKGAHYTSEENIRRVIDPLFLDELKAEFAELRTGAAKKKKLEGFHDKLATLRFLDPACGCGNFLVVAYRELRALELELLQAIYGSQLALGLDIGDIVRVNVDQFYGIELEDFPALIAETALWLTDHQVNIAVSKAFGRVYTRIPLKKSPTIVQGNALRLNWNEILPPEKCNYVLGNPPFIGGKYQTKEQRSDMASVCGDVENYGLLDYVCAWYLKAADYIADTRIRCAFVSTNSITQGEQVSVLWLHLFQRKRIKIQFAHRTFVWNNEASGKAHVHVVIVGFGAFDVSQKVLFDYDGDGKQSRWNGTTCIGPYLITGSETVVGNQSAPLCPVPEIGIGNKPIDGGYYLFAPNERIEFLAKEPNAKPYFRRWIGSVEFINNIERWCLWLGDCPPNVLRNMPEAMRLVDRVAKYRLGEIPAKNKEDNDENKKRNEATMKLAEKPTRFHVENFPKSSFLVIPGVSSERRAYIPIGFIQPEVLASNLLNVVADATHFHFGVISSTMHMAWVRTVCGRLKSDYRYSNKLVYNNYPWPEPTLAQREAVEDAAKEVIGARASRLVAGSNLADLYDSRAMPAELREAHQGLDHVVDKCYRSAAFTNDRERVEYLFALYEKLTSPLAPMGKTKRSRKV